MANIAILTAAGIGSRTNQDIPKQFLNVNNIPIIVYTMKAFQNHPEIDEICVVILRGWENILTAYAKQFNITKLKYVVFGGNTGHESIYNGLKEISKYHSKNDIVIIHDGNRPLVSNDIISNNLMVQRKYGSAVTAIPCTEVVFVSDNGESSDRSIPRETLWRTQTPHSYKLIDLLDVHEKAIKDNFNSASASCSLMERYGVKTFFSKGSEKNLKITTTDDLEIFAALLKSKKDDWIK